MTPPHPSPLRGQTALITGAAKRIGRAIALAYANAGADIAITYRKSSAEAEETLQELKSLGIKGSAHRCDLDDAAAIKQAVANVVMDHGRLDLLVNNAGKFASSALETMINGCPGTRTPNFTGRELDARGSASIMNVLRLTVPLVR